jgi:hypothetical protein
MRFMVPAFALPIHPANLPFKANGGGVTVTLDSSAPTSAENYGGEFIAEVFELTVEHGKKY